MTDLGPLILSVFALAVLGTGGILCWFKDRAGSENPSGRPGDASFPPPEDGGLAITSTILLVWAILVATGYAEPAALPIIALAFLLMGVSWLSGFRESSQRLHIFFHAGAAIAAVFLLDDDALIFQGLLPYFFDRVLAALLWVWFISIYERMDRIDGMTGIETISIGLGLILVPEFYGAALSATVAAAGLGFLIWNWHPAQITLGKSGSFPLGFLLGWLLLNQAAQGQWVAALILPSYYLVEIVITQTGHLFRRSPVPLFCDRAIQGGLTPSAISLIVLFTNGALIALAVWSVHHPIAALLGAGMTLATLLWLFRMRELDAKKMASIPK